MRARSDRTSRSVAARMGIGLGLVLGVVAIALIVLGDTRKQVTVGVLVGAWSGVIGALAVGPSRGSRDSKGEPAGGELAVRRGAEVEPGSVTGPRREYELQLEVMLRRELEDVLRTELSQLRTEVAGLRSDLVEKVNGQLRLERIETTRVIGSDIEALQHEVRRLAGSRDAFDSIPRSVFTPGVTEPLGSVMDQLPATTVQRLAPAPTVRASSAAPPVPPVRSTPAVPSAPPVLPAAAAPVPATRTSPPAPVPRAVPSTAAATTAPPAPATRRSPIAPATMAPPDAPTRSPVPTQPATPLEPVLPAWSRAEPAASVPSPRLDMFAGLPRLGRFVIDDPGDSSAPRAPNPSTLPVVPRAVDEPPAWTGPEPGPAPGYVGRRRIHDPGSS